MSSDSYGIDQIDNAFVSKLALTFSNQTILLAISGGVDSCVLAHMLSEAKLSFALAHCNFHLRGTDSKLDQQFVEDLANEYNVPVFTKSFHIEGSVQTEARDIRYKWFYQLMKAHGFDHLFTAHQLNDSLETLFINIRRGTGIRGLSGIPSSNNWRYRPLSNVTKEAVLNYASLHNLRWREDRSNADLKYVRNTFRHKVVNHLFADKAFVSGYLKSKSILESQCQVLEDAIALFKEKYLRSFSDVEVFSIKHFVDTNGSRAILNQWLSQYSSGQLTDLIKLFTDSSIGKEVTVLSTKTRFIREREHILIVPIHQASTDRISPPIVLSSNSTHYALPLKSYFQMLSALDYIQFNKAIEVDMPSSFFPLKVRQGTSEDYVVVNSKRKKLFKYLRDMKFPLYLKDKVVLIENSNAEVVFILGIGSIFIPDKLNNNFKLKLCVN